MLSRELRKGVEGGGRPARTNSREEKCRPRTVIATEREAIYGCGGCRPHATLNAGIRGPGGESKRIAGDRVSAIPAVEPFDWLRETIGDRLT